MTTEYWLQKKTIGGWSHVTSYTDLEQAQRNFKSCVGNGLSGYCWRLCKVETIEEALLTDVVDIPPNAVDAIMFGQSFVKDGKHIPAEKVVIKSGWGQPVQDAPKSGGWGSGWAEPKSKASDDPYLTEGQSTHGLTGSVWVIHHAQRHKARVPSSELDSYLRKGYVRGGPRTQFEG